MLDQVGTKWNPRIEIVNEAEGTTHLGFDSAWSPPNELLTRLHAKTNWKIVNRHDDPDAEHDLVLTCEDGVCAFVQLPGTTTCTNCEGRWQRDDIDDEHGECPLCRIGRADYLVTVEPDGAAIINTGERGSADLLGDVVLGVFSARSHKQAMILACCQEVPQEAREGFDWYEDPESFGLKAYKLADGEEGGG